jgi:hypothetical protein
MNVTTRTIQNYDSNNELMIECVEITTGDDDDENSY